MTNKNCILSSAYWAPIQYFSKFLIYDNIMIEAFENYQKKTYRNRCYIYSVNGKQMLNVPIEKSTKPKVLTKDVKIAYHTSWQKNHIKSIEAAYASTPFYEFFIDEINEIYDKNHKFLMDLNNDILSFCFENIGITKQVGQTSKFNLTLENTDIYRDIISPKNNPKELDGLFNPKTYFQGFEQRNGFIENLSILDLIFNTGSEAISILKG